MATPPSRQPKGIPVGGQFAATAHSESDLTLDQANGEPALHVPAGPDTRLAQKLTSGGLKGTQAPYTGDNPDYSQMKALASGSPLLLEQAKVSATVKKLRTLHAVDRQSMVAARKRINAMRRETD